MPDGVRCHPSCFPLLRSLGDLVYDEKVDMLNLCATLLHQIRMKNSSLCSASDEWIEEVGFLWGPWLLSATGCVVSDLVPVVCGFAMQG